ncbi:hypothetical protein ACJMK2_029709 [Sinanodonta woodiana]|uniref:dolichyl-phosphate-mannose--protein mannosyltransferase n=1 Tax=Sinanodonta woodiana TaxID=1069815 RepID=A0ABD3XEN7_SINWO
MRMSGEATDGRFTLYSSILCVTVALCYFNSLECGFVFDDMSAVVANNDLRPHVPLRNLFWDDFWGTPMHMEKSHKSYRPLCVLTFRINYLISELEPMSYHLVNIILHAVVCILFMRFCCMFLQESVSFLAALLFAVHPIHTEAVTGIVGRAESLSSVFFLAALFTYSKCTGYHKQTAWRPLIVTVVFVTIAMLCKEQGITVIGVCCVYEVFVAQKATFAELLQILQGIFQGKPKIPTWLKGSITRSVFLVGSTLFLLVARIKIMGAQLPVFTKFDNPASVANTPSRQLTYNYLLAINSWLLLNPSELCCDWTMGTIPLIESLVDYRNVFTLMFYLTMFKLGIYALRNQNTRTRAVIMSLSLLVLPFIPASNLFFPVGFVVAERILYTPSMGFCMMVALGFDVLVKNKKSLKLFFWLIMSALILSHAAKTYSRNNDWKSEYTIFRSALKMNQKNAKLWNNVGHALEKVSKFDEALEYFQKAVSVQPDDIGAHMNVGRTYKTLNMSVEAEAAFRMAMNLFPPIIPGKSYTTRVAPNHLNVFLNLAALVSRDPNRLTEADDLLRTAVNMRPDYVEGYINRGDIMVRMKRLQDAIEQYELAKKYAPDNADVHYNLGVVYLEMGKPQLAYPNFEEALNFDPDHWQSLYNSAIMMQESGDPKLWPEALKRLEKLKKRDVNDPQVYFTLGMLNMDMKNYSAAEQNFKKALELKSDFRSALFNLALMLSHNVHRPLDAVPYLEKLIEYHPDHFKGRMLMGDININHLKKLDEAEKNFLYVVQNDPKNVQAKHNLCVVYVEKGDLLRAEKCLTEAHGMAPNEEYIKNHLNIVRGRIQAARKQQQQQQQQQQQAQNQGQGQQTQFQTQQEAQGQNKQHNVQQMQAQDQSHQHKQDHQQTPGQGQPLPQS